MLHRPLPRIQYITNIINIICSCENFSCLGTYIIYYSLYSPHQLDVVIFQVSFGMSKGVQRFSKRIWGFYKLGVEILQISFKHANETMITGVGVISVCVVGGTYL